MVRTLRPNCRDNKDIILDRWKQVASHYWNHKMLAAELGLSYASVSKMIRRARAAGDKRAVPVLIGKSPW